MGKGRREKVLDSIGTLQQTVNEFQIYIVCKIKTT